MQTRETIVCNSIEIHVAVPPTSTMNTDPIAFYSFISADTTTKLQLHQTLIYDTVKINSGQGYHQDDGMFIAPRSGIYGFAWTLGVLYSGWASRKLPSTVKNMAEVLLMAMMGLMGLELVFYS